MGCCCDSLVHSSDRKRQKFFRVFDPDTKRPCGLANVAVRAKTFLHGDIFIYLQSVLPEIHSAAQLGVTEV